MNLTNSSEENVKVHIVLKILDALGYTSELELEHSYGHERPDIIIKCFDFDQPIVIEVKGGKENLNKHISQLERYSYSFSSLISILTNGFETYIYSPFWKRPTFEKRLIFGFSLKQLENETCVNGLYSLLNKEQGFKKIKEYVCQLESKIIQTEGEIETIKQHKNQTKKEIDTLFVKYPNIKDLINHIAFLDSTVKNEIEEYQSKENELVVFDEKIKNLKSDLPRSLFAARLFKAPIVKTNKKITPTQEFVGNEDFWMGITDEVINIRALNNGQQIALCKSKTKSNHRIFLISKKSYNSAFEPSDIGKKLMDEPIIYKYTQHVAEIEFIEIPGTNRTFWEEMGNIGEFNLWDIDNGPYLYFTRNSNARKKKYFWLFRVYQLPFKINEEKDFSRPHMTNSKIHNRDVLSKVQKAFKNNECQPVISDSDYQKRKNKIIDLIKTFQPNVMHR